MTIIFTAITTAAMIVAVGLVRRLGCDFSSVIEAERQDDLDALEVERQEIEDSYRALASRPDAVNWDLFELDCRLARWNHNMKLLEQGEQHPSERRF